ncbi:DUF3105 domain-containing protein [Micromonosporaceae bacterium DT55]|uniref:DUF3105 domain-containing protein n=1 Tax=Melissospora conviva TaxID=3388432 RepID=UPI003C224270
MSISTPGGNQRRPDVVSSGKKSGAGKPAGGNQSPASARKSTANRTSSGSAGKKGRKPITPVKVSQGTNWGPIALFAVVGLVAVSIVGYTAFLAFNGSKPWEERAAAIDGISNFRESDPELVAGGNHVTGSVNYTVVPPVAGEHNAAWQNCTGNVYDAPIANEHAVHSLEHGAIWITYRPDLAPEQVAKLQERVVGTEKMMMSPFDGLDSPISLQAWGYQLKLDNADDSRIDDFIRALRVNASIEGPNALCEQGVTATGTTPRNLAGM